MAKNFKPQPTAEFDFDEFEASAYGFKREVQEHKQLIINQLQHCQKELSKDLRVGGTYNVPTQNGVLPIYFPDQREVITQSIQTLYDLMLFYFDEAAVKTMNNLKENIKGANKKFYEIYIQVEYSQTYKQIAEKTKMIQVGPHSNVGEMLNTQMESYVLEQYREMFRELNLLFKRKNELSNVIKLNR